MLVEEKKLQTPKIIHPVDAYFDKTDWLRKENANQNISYSNLKGHLANDIIREYTLSKYPAEIVRLHNEGYIHIHDLSNGIVPYCNGIDFLQLLNMGLITDRIVSKPPKHLDTALNQLLNRFMGQQQEWAGAQAAGDFNTLLAPFVAIDNLNYTAVKQAIQRYYFDSGYPTRSGNETAFTNIMLNIKCPHFLSETSPRIYPNDTYADFEDEAEMILRAVTEVAMEGDGIGNPFTFPIPTLNVLRGTDYSTDLWHLIGQATAKFGPFYFMNFDGSKIDPNSIRAMCCHFNVDMSQLADASGRWTMQGSTGSIGIVTLNLGKLGYISKDESELYSNLNYILEKSKQSLLMKETWVNEMLEGGYLPITKIYGTDFSKYFRTIGILGLNEFCVNFAGGPIWENKPLAKALLNYIREWTRTTQLETGKFWNFEETPGESTATSFAKIDRAMYGNDIFVQGNGEGVYYSNLITPTNADMNLFERIDVEEDLLGMFTGGTVFRSMIGESEPDPDSTTKLISRIARNTAVPYFDLTGIFGTCQSCGAYYRGIHDRCECGGPIRTVTRIVGYYRDITRANVGKVQEILNRSISIH